jgi:predicted transcriptional regulator
MHDWTFLDTHGLVALCIARDQRVRLREIAAQVGITERAAHRIIGDLLTAGYITREREGRRNRYQIDERRPLRHPLERGRDLGALLDLFDDAIS